MAGYRSEQKTFIPYSNCVGLSDGVCRELNVQVDRLVGMTMVVDQIAAELSC